MICTRISNSLHWISTKKAIYMAWKNIGKTELLTFQPFISHYHHSWDLCFVLIHGIDRAFHHYRKMRNQKEPLQKHPELERLLNEEYRSLEDFRAKEKNAAKAAKDDTSKVE